MWMRMNSKKLNPKIERSVVHRFHRVSLQVVLSTGEIINIFGPRENVIKGIKLIRVITYEPADVLQHKRNFVQEFNQPCWYEYFERKEAEEAMLMEPDELEKGKQQAEKGGSCDDGESSAKEATVESCESEKKMEKQKITTFGYIKYVYDDDHELEILGKGEGGSGVTR
ncbi:unnamed protein product [Lactuca saligna]|uniref:Uncharacterized protein n=1 Tax=Lactuca saligna TaxID=75948 RepID=A0AA35VT35_LACSI|nr:unnamed protein product [Lactuca saligna]